MHIFRKLLYTVKSVDTLKFSLRHFSVNFVQFYLNLIKEMVYLTQLIYSAFFFFNHGLLYPSSMTSHRHLVEIQGQ